MTRGIRTTGGSLAYKDRVPDADSAVVERVRQSGAIILGKTTRPSSAAGRERKPAGRRLPQPWNPERTSGASQRRRRSRGHRRPVLDSDGWRRRRLHQDTRQLLRHLRHKADSGQGSSYSGVPAAPLANYTSQQGPMSRTVRDSAIPAEGACRLRCQRRQLAP